MWFVTLDLWDSVSHMLQSSLKIQSFDMVGAADAERLALKCSQQACLLEGPHPSRLRPWYYFRVQEQKQLDKIRVWGILAASFIVQSSNCKGEDRTKNMSSWVRLPCGAGSLAWGVHVPPLEPSAYTEIFLMGQKRDFVPATVGFT